CNNPEWTPELSEAQKPAYVAFSPHFQNYLRDQFSDMIFHPRLEQTSQALDKIITLSLNNHEEQNTLLPYPTYTTYQSQFATIFNNWEKFHSLFSKQEAKDEQYWR